MRFNIDEKLFLHEFKIYCFLLSFSRNSYECVWLKVAQINQIGNIFECLCLQIICDEFIFFYFSFCWALSNKETIWVFSLISFLLLILNCVFHGFWWLFGKMLKRKKNTFCNNFVLLFTLSFVVACKILLNFALLLPIFCFHKIKIPRNLHSSLETKIHF